MEIFMKYQNMDELRNDINLLDDELLSLFDKRFNLIKDAAFLKSNFKELRDNERIDEVIKRMREKSSTVDLSEDLIEDLWRYIIELSIKYETEIFNKK
jgi:isochorismate pyruvate lyase|tara:strand:- start:1439 stop:1732 length:294 start_codon:yes stop_codon:yes gene_type:complete